ncbi:probable E3 ubiquitin-protein ligase TRIML1 [Petaurus breviceps papuanus]|uniref:probable E3 ubiquitin-protein ligase TRIML1 n=1 Tax=Petaurus breviceps papuanus TaxID=3040969 RepID=UPI0036DF0B3B
MASARKKLQGLQREITCSICRSYFSEPITISCGHSFCRTCLSRSWRLGGTPSSCPECRQMAQTTEIPGVNGRLAEMTDLVKQLCSENFQSDEGQRQCASHKLTFKLFCEDDQKPLCVRCAQSPEHGAHKLSPVVEAAHNCRKKLQVLQSLLEKHLEEAEKLLAGEAIPAVDWHWMITEEFNKLHHFLLDEESLYLERLKQDERAEQDTLSQHVHTLQDLLTELQEAGHQPNVDLLWEVKHLLGRSASVLSQKAKAVSPELREYPIPGTIEMLRRFRVDIIIDPTAASPFLTVSDDLKSVKAGEGWQVGTKNPEDAVAHYVFAEQAFSSGRQYWEVDVTQLPQWILGIQNSRLSRKRKRKRKRNEDSCASVFLLCCVKKEEDYYLQTYPGSLNHRVKSPVPRVGVYLEYSSGTLAFYNVLQHSLIYRFYPILFTAPVTPIFSPGPPLPASEAGPMTLCPVDSHLNASCSSCL